MKKLYTLVIILLPFLSFSQTVDPSFTASVTANSEAKGSWLFDDGSYLVWGDFQQVNGQKISGLVKFNADGTINNTFSSGAGTVGQVFSVAVQTDGKILVAGRFTSYNGTAINNVMRLNASGTIDATFSTNLTFYGFNQNIGLTVLSTGKILLTAPIETINGSYIHEDLIRLNTNGTRDATFDAPDFSGSLEDIAIQSDGKIIAAGTFTSVDALSVGRIVRLNANGAVDNTFSTGSGFNSSVLAIEIASASQILVGGYFTTFNGATMDSFVALNSTGGVATYPMNGKADQAVTGIHKQTDGKVVIVGAYFTLNSVTKNHIARLNTDGTVDNTFVTGTGANSFINNVSGNASNDILFTGSFTTYNGTARTQLAMVNNLGAVKPMTQLLNMQTPNFAENTIKYNSSKFLITHNGGFVNGTASAGFERMNLDGTLDATFHANTASVTGVRSAVVDATGRIVIGGFFTTINGNSSPRIARLDANGNLDMTFRTNVGTGFSSTVTAMALQSDGKIIVGGGFVSFNGNTIHRLARLNADGTYDNTFNTANGFSTTTGLISIETIVIQADGKILVGGEFSGFAGNTMKSLVRLNANGSIDATFNTGTGFESFNGNGSVYAILELSDGKILVGGHITKVNGVEADNYVRLSSTGTRDATFTLENNNIIESIIKTASGHILITDRSVISRALSDGTIDDTFNPIQGSYGSSPRDVLDFGNELIVGGYLSGLGSTNVSGLAKILIPPAPAAPTTLNGSASSPTQVVLTWTDNASNENGFKIERSLSGTTGFTQIGKVAANIKTFTDNSAVQNTTYYYRVYAYNAGGVSAYSNVKSITTPESIPNAPTGVQVTVQASTTLRVSWTDASTNEANFIVRRSTDNANFTIVATLGANTTSYDNTGLTVGTRYYYRITSKNTAGESTIASGSGLAGAYPMTAGTLTTCEGIFFDPGGEGNYSTNMNVTETLSPSNAGSSVSLEFTAFQTNAGFDALSIYDGSNTSAPLIGTYSGTTSPGKVVASNVNGTLTLVFTSSSFAPLSGWSAKIGCLVIPAKPTNLAVAAFNTNTTKLTWTDNATTETGFSLERSVSNTTSFATIATLPANTTTYQDNTVDKNITYYYRLRALGTTDHSAYTSFAGIAFGDGGVWTLKTDMTGPARTDAIGFGIADKGYAGTGMTGSYAADIRIYDATTNAWSTGASYGGSIRAEAASFVINGKGYVGTGEGFDMEQDLWEYNPTANTWTQKANFPGSARRNSAAFSANGIGYLGTGTDGALKKDFYSYNPTNNTWTAIADFPGAARQGAVAFSIGGIGYVGTGSTASGKVKDFYKYDPAANAWTKIADFPGTARTEAVAFVVGGKGYVGTGESNTNEKDFYVYDPAANTWTKIVSFAGTGRYVATAFETTTKGFVGTGFDGANRSDFWEFVNTTVPAPPAAPSGVTVTVVSATQLKIDWTDNATNETGYSLERSTSNESNYTEVASLPANTATYTNTGLTANTTYYYRVKALNASIGNSTYSASANGTTLPLPPAAPTTLAATAQSSSQIKLTWVDASSNEAAFVIMRSLVSNADFAEIATTLPNTTTYTDIGLNEATTYYYKVFARNTGGSSSMTSVAQATTPIAPVTAPSTLQVVSSSFDKVKLSWTDNSSNETEFRLERSADNILWNVVYTIGANTTQYEDVDVDEATTYYYRVKAKSALGESAFTNVVNTTTPKSIPVAPSNLVLSYNEATTVMTLQWTDNSFNEDEFIIERSTDGVTFEEIGTSTTGDFEDVISLVHIARYRVLARNSAGKSGYSNIASQVVTGIENNLFDATVSLAPNPATETIAIGIPQGTAGEVQIEMYNTAGVQMKREQFTKGNAAFTKTVRVAELPKGLVMIRIMHHGAVAVKKVILE